MGGYQNHEHLPTREDHNSRFEPSDPLLEPFLFFLSFLLAHASSFSHVLLSFLILLFSLTFSIVLILIRFSYIVFSYPY